MCAVMQNCDVVCVCVPVGRNLERPYEYVAMYSCVCAARGVSNAALQRTSTMAETCRAEHPYIRIMCPSAPVHLIIMLCTSAPV
jgi:hypothetical protein